MTSHNGQQIITIHTLPNILCIKGNEKMKFGQWKEYNIGYIFLEKSYAKCRGKASPRLLYKKIKLIIATD